MVVYLKTTLSDNPCCPHGPMLLFGRMRKNGECKQFYACAAYRDKKQCPFFLSGDKTIYDCKNFHYEKQKEILVKIAEKYKLNRLWSKNGLIKHFCYTCSSLICDENDHCNHNLTDINSSLLANPLQLLSAKSRSKGESQYFFAEGTIHFIMSVLLNMKVNAVLCVGCPSLHNLICNNQDLRSKVTSCLLDIDCRYFQFYDDDRFLWFNMFNCHMFNDNGWKVMGKLFAKHKTAVIIDPPFGGHIEPLANTFERFSSMAKSNGAREELEFMLISPYFMERNIRTNLPNFCMLDFKVEYTNHKKFKSPEHGGRKLGSPVRIFTNINTSLIKLPEDSYKFCSPCNKWVSRENKHCLICGFCTSKNGGTYVHCDICEKCVKATWKHCKNCEHCTLPDHKCLSNQLKKQPGFSRNKVLKTKNMMKRRKVKRKHTNE